MVPPIEGDYLMTAMKWENELNAIEDYEDKYPEQTQKPNRTKKASSRQQSDRKASRQAMQSERDMGRANKDLTHHMNNVQSIRSIRKVSELQAIRDYDPDLS
jgi:hypothetical protein